MKQKVLRADDFRFSEKEKDAAQNVLRPDASRFYYTKYGFRSSMMLSAS